MNGRSILLGLCATLAYLAGAGSATAALAGAEGGAGIQALKAVSFQILVNHLGCETQGSKNVVVQGTFRADVLAFIGEDVPNRIGWRTDLTPVLPEGYDFDACDATALFEAKVRDRWSFRLTAGHLRASRCRSWCRGRPTSIPGWNTFPERPPIAPTLNSQ